MKLSLQQANNPYYYKQFFQKHRAVTIPGIIILASILLLVFVLIPQLQALVNDREQTKITQERIRVLEDNLNNLTARSDTNLDTDLELSLKALPKEKDFTGILNAIRQASAKSGAGVSNFSFEVGDLSPNAKDFRTKLTLPVRITLQANSYDNINRFMQAIANSLPISEIGHVDMNKNGANIVVNFYYKPFARVNVEYATSFLPLLNNNAVLLKNLASWDSVITEEK